MTFDAQTLSAIVRSFDEKRLNYETAAAARQAEVYEKIPRIAEIDALLRTTILDIIKSTFSTGNSAAPMLAAVRENNLALQREKSELLLANGYPYDYTEAHYDCDKCSDTGYVNGEACTCLIEAYRAAQNDSLRQMFAGSLFGFDDFDLEYYPKSPIQGLGVSAYGQMEEVYNFCVEYAKHFGPASESLFMTGGSGLGKTMLASCIAHEAVAGGASVVYESAFPLFACYEGEKFGRDGDGSGTHRYRECDLLIIDDLGCEMTTAFTVSVLYNLVNSRLLAGKKTIICSNLGLSDIAKRYGSQLYSRLSGDYLTLVFYGEDIRAKKRKRI